MNKDQTLALIHQRFANVSSVGPDVVRAERHHNQSAIGVFYFDLSEAVARNNFVLSDYLQRNVATDFYKHEGSLQWNYYLYFVLGKQLFQDLLKNGTAAKIEADRTFARKLVRDDDVLQQELSNPLAVAITRATKTKDIAAEWTEELARAGLSAIGNPKAAYTRIVEQFLSAPSSQEPRIPLALPTAKSVTGVEAGKFIRHLNIEAFRRFPSVKTYDFGLVNLIRGTNGSGKTSLLEAIELSICGGIQRQDGGKPAGAHMVIQFEGDAKLHRCPQTSLPLYRLRDSAWYGAYYPGGNRLYRNFSRFNFFDTDAAFRLSEAKSQEEVQKAIRALFLGEFANTLEERMRACKERFEKEERDFSGRVERADGEIRKLNADLKVISDIRDTRESLSEDLSKHAAAHGWKKSPKQLNSAELVTLQGSVDDLCSRLRDFHRQLKWMPRVTISLLEQEVVKLKTAHDDIESKLTQTEKAIDAIEKLKEKATSVNVRLELLKRIIGFHDEPEGFSLRGLGKSISSTQTRLESLQEAARLLRGIETTPFETSAAKLDELIGTHSTQIKTQERATVEKRKRLSQMQGRVGEIRTLVSQIKTLGKEFCDLDPQAAACPLCETEYTKGELLNRIKKVLTGSDDDSRLRELNAEVAEAEAALKKLQRTVNDLKSFREAADLVLRQSHLESMTVETIVRKLAPLADDVSEEKEKLTKLAQTQKRLRTRGFTEEELDELIDEAKVICGLPLSTLENAAMVRRVLNEHEKLHERLAEDIREAEKKQKNTQVELQRSVKSALGKPDVEDPLVEVQRRLDLMTETLSAVRQEKAFSAPTDEEFASITNRLKAFGETIVRVETALKRVEEKDSLQKSLASSLQNAQGSRAKSEAVMARAKDALKVLNKLLKVENKAAYLQEIVRQHREKLVAIFTRIHAPNDFDDARLNGDIVLRRHGGGDARVSEISTGQRAALALSIFLSLNSGVSERAPWLLFDDPVVHVDDLNTLSFLDSLRDLVLLGNRQVFFATANTRIANLFTRKFDFLGDEFRDFPLERAPANLS